MYCHFLKAIGRFLGSPVVICDYCTRREYCIAAREWYSGDGWGGDGESVLGGG